MTRKTVALIGARGYTGRELITLLQGHPGFELVFVGSRELDGTRVSEYVEGFEGDLCFGNLGPEEVAALGVDVCVLALPNKVSAPFVAALDAAGGSAVLDLSADARFDDTWVYGWPERRREEIKGATRVSNPGCYATGMQVALWPMLSWLDGPAHAFGVSGYSGAGTKPSPKNDVTLLQDNLIPYALVGHMHEREVTRQMERPLRFMPHVAPFFRGITLTVAMTLSQPKTLEEIEARYAEVYAGEPLVRLHGAEVPLVRDVAGEHVVNLGGVTLDGVNLTVVVTLDNLLKGAATQAMQNMNLMAGFDELTGVPVEAS